MVPIPNTGISYSIVTLLRKPWILTSYSGVVLMAAARIALGLVFLLVGVFHLEIKVLLAKNTGELRHSPMTAACPLPPPFLSNWTLFHITPSYHIAAMCLDNPITVFCSSLKIYLVSAFKNVYILYIYGGLTF